MGCPIKQELYNIWIFAFDKCYCVLYNSELMEQSIIQIYTLKGESLMPEVKFYDNIDDSMLEFAVIISRSQGKYVFCKHRERNTYEIPGGRREEGESIFETANRELKEETGALIYDIKPVCVYSVTGKTRVNKTGEESFGMLYYAEIEKFSDMPDSEIERIELFDEIPAEQTYPLIQPKLIEELNRREKMMIQKEQKNND